MLSIEAIEKNIADLDVQRGTNLALFHKCDGALQVYRCIRDELVKDQPPADDEIEDETPHPVVVPLGANTEDEDVGGS